MSVGADSAAEAFITQQQELLYDTRVVEVCREKARRWPRAARRRHTRLSLLRHAAIRTRPDRINPAPKPAPKPKPAPAKKVVAKKSYGKSPKGKGGIFPWITNEPGSANPARTHVQAVCRRCRRLLQPPAAAAAAAAAAARAPLMLRRGRGRIAAQMLRKLSAAS